MFRCRQRQNQTALSAFSRCGYSLLELILSMGLMVVIMSAVAGAINIYMVRVSRQQARIERELVSRNALSMMANDIRAAVQYKAADYGGINTLLESISLANGVAAGEITSEEAAELEESEEENPLDEEAVSFRPTLIGTAQGLRVDISRLPRLDQYNPLVALKASGTEATISDIKSVAYFFSSQAGGYDPNVVSRENEVAGGMYRREIDRAVAQFRGDDALPQSPDEFCELVATEVAEIQFRYFNGQDWSSVWDSVEDGGFPTAVEISLVVDPQRTSSATTNYQYNGFDAQAMERHKLTVYLPTAEPEPEEEQQ